MQASKGRIKCVLESHYRIPSPILSILMGYMPKVSSSIEDVTDENLEDSQYIRSVKEDDWNNVSEDEVEEEPLHTSPTPSTTSEIYAQFPSPSMPANDNILFSASADGETLVLAHKSKFVMVRLNNEEEYSAVGQGSGCQSPSEEITAVVCLPLFVPSTRLTQHYILCGYNTGWIRVFSESGILLTEQQLEITPVVSIKIRTPPPVFKIANQRQFANENEDITVLFRGNKIVTIDGQSLWMVLRVCDGQRESGIDASHMHTAFTYKKWDLQHQDEVNDIISLGPSPTFSQTPYIDPSTTISTTSSFPPKDATARYIGVGAHPMLTYYATSESSKPLMSAASMASYVVSRVASPVFSFAKSWWGSSGTNNASNRYSTSIPNSHHSSNTDSPTPYVPDLRRPPPNHIEPATPLPAILSANDPYRKINHVYLSPPPPISAVQRPTLAATTDALGRVVLWDIQEGHMLRIWKGVRDAVCGWVEVFEHDLYPQDVFNDKKANSSSSKSRVLLFLVMYSAKSGFLKVFQMRHGKQVGAYHVGPGWQLVSCGGEPLGSCMVTPERRRKLSNKDSDTTTVGKGHNGLANCLLIGHDGEVRKVNMILRKTLPDGAHPKTADESRAND